MTTRKRTQSALRATLKQEDAAVAERLPEVASANALVSDAPAAVEVPSAAAVSQSAEVVTAKGSSETDQPAVEQKAVAKPAATRSRAAPKKTAVKAAAPKAAAPKVAAPKAAEAAKPVAKAVKVPGAESDSSIRSATTVSAAAKSKAPVKSKSAAKSKAAAKDKAPAKLKAAAKPVADVVVPAVMPEVRKEKAGKVVRDSFSMPKSEHAAFKRLRTALARAGRLATKSEVLRAAMKLLGERSTKELLAVLDSLPVVVKGKGKKQG